MPRIVGNVARGREYLVQLRPGGDPFQIDELRNEELRQRLLDVVLAVDTEQPKCPGRVVASVFDRQWQIVKEVQSITAASEERADIIGEPKATKNVHVGLTGTRREIPFRNKERNFLGHSVLAPDLHDVGNELWLVIEAAPRNFAWIVGIVLEREK